MVLHPDASEVARILPSPLLRKEEGDRPQIMMAGPSMVRMK